VVIFAFVLYMKNDQIAKSQTIYLDDIKNYKKNTSNGIGERNNIRNEYFKKDRNFKKMSKHRIPIKR
jgi:hypothetical protein